MTRQYSSFLIRYWRLANGTQRIEIEHFQSGDRTRTASLAAALAWIAIHEGGLAGDIQQRASTDERPRSDAEQAHIEDA